VVEDAQGLKRVQRRTGDGFEHFTGAGDGQPAELDEGTDQTELRLSRRLEVSTSACTSKAWHSPSPASKASPCPALRLHLTPTPFRSDSTARSRKLGLTLRLGLNNADIDQSGQPEKSSSSRGFTGTERHGEVGPRGCSLMSLRLEPDRFTVLETDQFPTLWRQS
jgi:hypothetical protein